MVVAIAPRTAPSVGRTSLRVTAYKAYPSSNWMRKDFLVIPASLIGWTLPASIPTPAFPMSPFAGLLDRTGYWLSQFPQGPPLTDDFWKYMVFYHAGLFAVIMFGQIGVTLRKTGYFDD